MKSAAKEKPHQDFKNRLYNKQIMKCAIYNTFILETTHFVTHIEKIICINVLLHIRCGAFTKTKIIAILII